MTESQNNHLLSIHPEILSKLPGLRIFIAILHNLDPSQVNKEACQSLLHQEWQACRSGTLSNYPNPQSHPYLAAWRRAYSSLGISTKKYTSSIENLARRAMKPDSIPRSINPLVDLYNACSLKFLIPFGGLDLADPAVNEIELRFSVEGDTFWALDGEGPEPLDGNGKEAVYVTGKDGKGHVVLTRHINWKQSREGLIGEESKDVIFMAECLGDISDPTIEEMSIYFEEKCKECLKGEGMTLEICVLSKDNPSLSYK